MKETVKEGRLYALFGKALLLFAAAFVMLCINPLIAHADDRLPMGSEEDGYYIDKDGNMTVYSEGFETPWLDAIAGSFEGYKQLVKTLTVNEGVTVIENLEYFYGSVGDIPFYECPKLTTVSLPASLTAIREKSFDRCVALTSVTIPAGVTSIGDRAFGSCTNLTSVTMLSETPPTIGEDAFDGAAFIYKEPGEQDGKKYGIFVPEDSVQAYKEAWPAYATYIYSPSASGGSETPDPGTDPDPGPGPDTPGNKGGGSIKDLDPTRKEATADKPAYADTTIDVQAHTVSSVVYSVDVEWGAMTFRYENSLWDATAHQAVTGAGWQVYDSVNDEVVNATEDAINRIQVTNHSNAEVKAALAYAGQSGYEDTTGSFTKAADDADTSYDPAAKTLTLASADNGKGEGGAGKETVGCVYFMPSGIKEAYKTSGITKWTQLGTITVGVETAEQEKETK